MSQQVNPKRTRYVVPGSAGVPLVIRLTCWAKYVDITEDPTANAGLLQGLQGYALDAFALSSNILLNSEALPAGVSEYEFGDKHNIHSGTSAPLGNPGSAGNVDNPGGVATLGTPLAQLLSNTATATAVWVTEYC
jgi:hypothetical protein